MKKTITAKNAILWISLLGSLNALYVLAMAYFSNHNYSLCEAGCTTILNHSWGWFMGIPIPFVTLALYVLCIIGILIHHSSQAKSSIWTWKSISIFSLFGIITNIHILINDVSTETYCFLCLFHLIFFMVIVFFSWKKGRYSITNK